MWITVYQTNTGHRAVGFYNESNAQNKFTFKCWSCHAFNVVHQLSSFCALCFAIFADEVVLVSPVWHYFRWRICTLSLNEAPKAHYFCFLLLIQGSAVQQKLNKATLPNNKTFSTVKLALYVQSLCLLLHNNFLVFNISDNCWESSHNLWTLPNHNSRVTCGFRFPNMLQRVRSIFYRPVLKTKRSGGTTGKRSLWDDG